MFVLCLRRWRKARALRLSFQVVRLNVGATVDLRQVIREMVLMFAFEGAGNVNVNVNLNAMLLLFWILLLSNSVWYLYHNTGFGR